MAWPLAILALGSVVTGFLGMPASWREALGATAPFFDFLAPVLPHGTVHDAEAGHSEGVAMLAAVGVALAGIVIAWRRYGGSRGAASVAAAERAGALRGLVSRGYYVDALYDAVVRVVDGVAAIVVKPLERLLAAGSLDEPATLARSIASRFGRARTDGVQAYVVYALVGLAIMLGWGLARG
jgi:NADH:ubiquinone oxidoreductase subunit 5 (subunit L)/multisubunit Na+/H+ antiporter MnhA subunit